VGRPGDGSALRAGETVLLVDRKARRYLTTLETGGQFHYHAGTLDHDGLIGGAEGVMARSSKGAGLRVWRPTAADYTLELPRGAQVCYPKDQAVIVERGDIVPGCAVVEAGAGSGALSAALLRAVGPHGRVTSVEHREDFADRAQANVTRRFAGLPANWDLERGEVAETLARVSCERVVLDLLRPWDAVPAAADALHPGGLLVCYMATVPQVMSLVESLGDDPRWVSPETTETIERGWHTEGLAVRPQHRMVAHTGFVTVAHRAPGEPPAGDRV